MPILSATTVHCSQQNKTNTLKQFKIEVCLGLKQVKEITHYKRRKTDRLREAISDSVDDWIIALFDLVST